MFDQLLGLETQHEGALMLLPVGLIQETAIGPSLDPEPLSLDTLPISEYEIDFPAIREMHHASSLTEEGEVASWRGKAPGKSIPHPSRRSFQRRVLPHCYSFTAPFSDYTTRLLENIFLARASRVPVLNLE